MEHRAVFVGAVRRDDRRVRADSGQSAARGGRDDVRREDAKAFDGGMVADAGAVYFRACRTYFDGNPGLQRVRGLIRTAKNRVLRRMVESRTKKERGIRLWRITF